MEQKKEIWFRAKRYGLGWYPVSWQGWVITLLYVVIILRTFSWADKMSHSGSDTLIAFAPPFIVITGLLLVICYKKGEMLKWRWGNK